MGITAPPVALTDNHEVSEFNCGNDTLNDWLIKRSLKNQKSGASRTFVICQNNQVVGYYALASGAVERMISPKPIARNMPEPIPVMVLGRLAMDTRMQGQKLGAALLKDALLRTLFVSKNVGIRAILVHAISEDAKRFYLGYGFQVSPIDPMTLMLPTRHIEGLL
ncbi:MAG: GNAT family N-acetyltransferase [Gammaproteobacteria bacterium]|nr:MAG: GNAT family N-acetyltransferase [Gammaproteobacteria bacterium]RLA20422.1 MAG: GNAT family N-acetyltransferase [Gammaproteobacteria bacterium]